MTVTGPTFNKSAGAGAKSKPKLNPYLAHRQVPAEVIDSTKSSQEKGSSDAVDAVGVDLASSKIDPSENNYVDARLEAAGHDAALISRRHRRRELKFIEPGTFVEIGERKRQRAANAESAGFASGRKAGQYFRPTTMMAGSGGGGVGDTNYYGTTEVLDDVEDRGVLAPRAEIGSTSLDDKANSNLRAMPMVVEWWDMELLPSKLKKQVSSYEGSALSKATQSKMQQFSATAAKDKDTEGNEGEASEGATTATAPATATIDKAGELRKKCSELAALSYSKTASLIQHIIPIPPPGETGKKSVEPVLYLTKKERKRARKRRREQKQRELQDLQAAGLIEPPEPRLTLQNFIRVMGDQAYVDPSQMERKVTEQVQKRQLAHLDRNASKKLTREQRADKLRSKVSKDATPSSNATGAIHVALFFVKSVSHPYHRTKLDLNAQQLSITGGVLECDIPTVSCVICEGGPRAIQKYKRLMLVRMKWKGPDDEGEDYEEEEDEEVVEEEQFDEDGELIPKKIKHRFDRENHCELVWTGMATKRQFKGFVFQHCETSAQAHKVLKSKGVGQYWDQVLAHASGSGDSLHLKLVDSDSENDNDDENEADDMKVDDANTAAA
jgi:U4/U6 small nuclear ribonucleoprotein PRP3